MKETEQLKKLSKILTESTMMTEGIGMSAQSEGDGKFLIRFGDTYVFRIHAGVSDGEYKLFGIELLVDDLDAVGDAALDALIEMGEI